MTLGLNEWVCTGVALFFPAQLNCWLKVVVGYLRQRLGGTDLRGQTPICGFSVFPQFPAKIGSFLQFPATTCGFLWENLRLPNESFSRKQAAYCFESTVSQEKTH